ncbi:hypothetical protein CPC16_006613 [Podila verticillata]|nr:hypothetical protein BGZ52_008887 [Haplosporangium bisporale]KAF9211911.1 hypothetical protein BGZ59_007468 [Podila verticillata]KAF9388221.1 hypothetical protein CPC16_006613 [Podila verticillata]
MAVHGMDCNSAAKDIEPRMQELKVAKSLESVTVASKRVYWVVVRDAGCKGAMQIVFTVGAAVEAALASVFVVMAHDPDWFTKANSDLARMVGELYMGTVERKAVVNSTDAADHSSTTVALKTLPLRKLTKSKIT